MESGYFSLDFYLFTPFLSFVVLFHLFHEIRGKSKTKPKTKTPIDKNKIIISLRKYGNEILYSGCVLTLETVKIFSDCILQKLFIYAKF